jgi:hypothetical protein
MSNSGGEDVGLTGNVRAFRNALEAESQRVDERAWRAQEELTELERRIEDAATELSGLCAHRSARRSGPEQAADAALEKVLGRAVGEVIDAVQTGYSEGEIGPGERLLRPAADLDVAAGVRRAAHLLALASEERAVAHGGSIAGSSSEMRRVSVQSVVGGGSVEDSFEVLITASTTFAELSSLAQRRWALDVDDPKVVYSLVDDSGTAWPLDAIVSRDVFGAGGGQRLPTVYLHSKERVRISHRVDLGGASAAELPQLVAPILGEYAMRRHDQLLSAEASLGAAPERGAGAARQSGALSVLAARRKTICVVLAYLTVVIAMSLVIAALGTPTSLSSVLEIAKSLDNGASLSGSSVELVSSWRDVAVVTLTTLYTSLVLARVKLVMPMRFFQTRVGASNILPAGSAASDGSGQCPAFQVPMAEYPGGRGVTKCFPGFDGATAAQQFFQGLDDAEELTAIAQNSTYASAYVLQSNPWTLADQMSFPPSASPDIPATSLHPSAGYLYDLSLTEDGYLPPDAPQQLSNLPVAWLDPQTRYFSIEVVYANPNEGSLTLVRFAFTTDEVGAFDWLSNVVRVPVLSDTWRYVLYGASAATVLALLVIAYQRVQNLAEVRAAHAARASEKIVTERRERLTRRANLAAGLDNDGDAAVARRLVNHVGVFLDWMLQIWTLVDLAIIGFALAAVVLGLLSVQCSRLSLLKVPSPRYVSLDIVSMWVWASCVCAVHAIVLVIIKVLIGYNPVAVYTVKEVGAVWYGTRYLAPLGLLLFCLILAVAYVVRLTAPAVGDFLVAVSDWTAVVFGLAVPQEALVPLFWVPFSLVVVPAVVFVMLRFSVGMAYQSIIKVSSETMSMQEREGLREGLRQHLPGLTAQIAAAASRWYHDSKLGKPNY